MRALRLNDGIWAYVNIIDLVDVDRWGLSCPSLSCLIVYFCCISAGGGSEPRIVSCKDGVINSFLASLSFVDTCTAIWARSVGL